MIVGEIGEIRKLCVDRVTAEMIIGVITRMTVKELSGSTAGIDFRRMIEDFMMGDTNLEMGDKRTILVEGNAEIEEIDTGDKPPVVSRPHRYDRVKQAILDYHVEKMLKEETIVTIQSPHASLDVEKKLVMVSDGTKFALRDIERLFDEARRNTKAKYEKWEKYYNRRGRNVQVKVNDWS
ncbi:uncharacterized protein TNCV_149651 [Trichonephila clavipes]|nr:uncharacterized protein TNCV_149651 [Trichonephila clavipes]